MPCWDTDKETKEWSRHKVRQKTCKISQQEQQYKESRSTFFNELVVWEVENPFAQIGGDIDAREHFKLLCDVLGSISTYHDKIMWSSFVNSNCRYETSENLQLTKDALKDRYYRALHSKLLEIEEACARLSKKITASKNSADVQDLLIKSKLIAATTSVTASKLAKNFKISGGEGSSEGKSKRCKGISPYIHIRGLYSYMDQYFLRSGQTIPQPLIGAGLHWKWRTFFHIIIRESMSFYEGSSKDKMEFLTTQLSIIGHVVKDPAGIDTILKLIYEEGAKSDWVEAMKPFMGPFHDEMSKVLLSEIWLPEYQDKTEFSREDIEKLLNQIESSTVFFGLYHEEISKIKAEWEKLDIVLEQRVNEVTTERDKSEIKRQAKKDKIEKLRNSRKCVMDIVSKKPEKTTPLTQKGKGKRNARKKKTYIKNVVENAVKKLDCSWENASEKFNKADYDGAISDYNQCLLIAKSNEQLPIMIELADASAQLVMQQREEIYRTMVLVSIYHEDFQKVETMQQGVRIELPSKSDVRKLSNNLLNGIRDLGLSIEKSVKYHQDTISLLNKPSLISPYDCQVHFQLIKEVLESLTEIDKEIAESTQLLEKLLTLRKNWLDRQPKKQRLFCSEPWDVASLIKEIELQLQQSKLRAAESEQLCKSLEIRPPSRDSSVADSGIVVE